ncbi:FtsX-like permease family protein [candidate division WWE3 bacterium]|nr:FtsX-like permease family protein [candidate division WWE3 bacterium]
MINFKNAYETMKKERVLSFSNLLVMTITFLVLGVFLLVVFLSQSTLAYLEQQTQVTAFFRDDFTEERILQLQAELQADERISNVEYISKEEALQIFTEINKDEPLLVESISANILPASLKIQTRKIEDLKIIAEEIAPREGVEGVKFFEDVVSQFQKLANVLYIAGFILTAVFLFISYSAIVITLRTYINRKGTELEILKLVGASNDYVQAPIISQGLFFSLTSSIFATVLLLLGAVVATLLGVFDSGLLVPFTTGFRINLIALNLIFGIILLASGILLGYLGSKSTVKKYLNY